MELSENEITIGRTPQNHVSRPRGNRQGVRFCGSCNKQVFYCSSVPEARNHAMAGHCVAVDVVAIRRPRDLDSPMPVRVGMIVPYRDE